MRSFVFSILACGVLAVMAIATIVPVQATEEEVPMEWTFEQARRMWKPMIRPVQHVGVPGYQFQTGVVWDGSLVFGPMEGRGLTVMQQEIEPFGNHYLHVSIGHGDTMTFADRRGSENSTIRRSLESGRLPVPHILTPDGDLLWHQVVFAHLLDRDMVDGMDPQDNDMLVTHSVFTVRNTGYAKRTGRLWLHFGDTSQIRLGYKVRVTDELGPSVPYSFEAPYGVMDNKVRFVIPSPTSGAIRSHAEIDPPSGSENGAQNVLEWEVELAPGEEATLRLIIPYGLVDRPTAQRMANLDSTQKFNEVISFYKDLQYGPGMITTPDPFVNDYLIAVSGQMSQQVAYRQRSTGTWMYKTSPNFYEMLWPCNAAKALPALDLRGLTDINRKVLQSFIDHQTADIRGLDRSGMGHGDVLAGEGYAEVHGFIGNFDEWTANPLLLSHGLGMWALASHYRITRDDAWLGQGPGSPLQAMIDAFDWVTVQRQRTMREENGKKVDHWGLLPAASAHDWLAGNTIFNDAFCIYGMAEVVRLLHEINHSRANELSQELAAYRKDLHDRYSEARDRARPVPLPDGTTIPYVPRIVQELDWADHDWTYTGYGPIRAGAWGALDPHDELVSQSLAYLEAGLPQGEGPMFAQATVNTDIADRNFADVADPEAERHYVWRHYVEYETMWPIGGPLFLARDDLPRFFEWLFNNLAVVLHKDWRVGVESLDGVPSCAPGDGERWQMIRRMFVNERGGYDGSQQSLWLMQAIPRSWLRPGYTMKVSDMATWFGGKVSLDASVADDGNSVQIDVALNDLAVEPTEVRIRLRSGDGRPLKSAEIDGKAAVVSEGDTVLLPSALSGNYRVVGHF